MLNLLRGSNAHELFSTCDYDPRTDTISYGAFHLLEDAVFGNVVMVHELVHRDLNEIEPFSFLKTPSIEIRPEPGYYLASEVAAHTYAGQPISDLLEHYIFRRADRTIQQQAIWFYSKLESALTEQPKLGVLKAVKQLFKNSWKADLPFFEYIDRISPENYNL